MNRADLIFGREPALILGATSTLIQLLSSAVLPLTVEQQTTLNGAVAALLGLVTAWAVSSEKAVPAILGLVQAALALGIAYGWQVNEATATGLTATAAALCALWVRGQVVAPVSGPPVLRNTPPPLPIPAWVPVDSAAARTPDPAPLPVEPWTAPIEHAPSQVERPGVWSAPLPTPSAPPPSMTPARRRHRLEP